MSHLLTLSALAIFLGAAVTDIRRRQIPNGLVILLASLGLVRMALALSAGTALTAIGLDLTVALAVFAGGAALFALGLMGGGDVKLMAAGSIWFGTAATGTFLVSTVLGGGLLACLFLMRRGFRRFAGSAAIDAPDSLPYGVAIALGGFAATLQMP